MFEAMFVISHATICRENDDVTYCDPGSKVIPADQPSPSGVEELKQVDQP